MELRAKDVIERDFSTRRRGYDMDEVDEFLEVVARRLHQLQQELDESTQSLNRPIELAGHQIAELFARAQQIHDEVAAEAETMRTRAGEETGAQRQRLLEEARAEAAEERTRAQEQAAALVRDAEEQAEQIRRESEDMAETRTRAAEERVRAAEERLLSLRQNEQKLIAQLREIERSLRSVAGIAADGSSEEAEGNGATSPTPGGAPEETYPS